MSFSLKPLQLWGVGSSNPPKVAFILEELGIPYEGIPLGFDEVKTPRIIALNPNGRMPILQDPNTDLIIWESGAILQYLISTYDKNHQLSFPANSPDFWTATEYLFFQVSGQGPYYGNAFYFKRLADPPNPAATARFVQEIKRVSSVIEDTLSKAQANERGEKWLVGGKLSYVDFAFLPYQLTATLWYSDDGFDEAADFPQIKKWKDTLLQRPTVKTVLLGSAPWKDLGLYN